MLKMQRSRFAFTSPENVLQDNELEEMRLKKLLQDSILKAEKENWELVLKEIQEELKSRDKCDSKSSIKPAAVKPLVRKPLKIKMHDLLQPSSQPSVSVPKKENNRKDESVCCSKKSSKQHSTIHFLNHFQASLDSSKQFLSKKTFVETKKPYAVPLTPPEQIDNLEKPVKLEKIQTKKINKGLYCFTSKEKVSNLTLQSLPSISIDPHVESGRKRPNVYFEEICEVKSNSESSARTSLYPTGKTSCFCAALNPSEITLLRSRLDMQQSEKSISSSNRSYYSHNQEQEVITSKDTLKSLAKEIVTELQQASADSRRADFYPKNTSVEIAEAQAPIQKETKSLQDSNKFSASSQTDFSPEILNYNTLKNVIKEVVIETQAVHSDCLCFQSSNAEREKRIITNEFQMDKKIQANFCPTKNPELESVSKETQVTLLQVDETHSSDNVNEATAVTKQELNQEISGTEKNDKLASDVSQQLAVVTLRVENLINSFNNHVLRASDLATKDTVKNNVSDNLQPVSRREVSLQCSPYLITQSVNTSPVRVFEKATQCENSDNKVPKKVVANICTQTTIGSTVKYNQSNLASKNVEIGTQCGPLSLADGFTQTEDAFLPSQVSEHSANTSVSSTPVSDSLFLDDVLSEGEIPWHLKFLSYHDKNAQCSSSNAAESTSASEEKDFSLSEGEIPPKYVQHLYNLQAFTQSPLKKDDSQPCASCSCSNISAVDRNVKDAQPLAQKIPSENTLLSMQPSDSVSNHEFADVSAYQSVGQISQVSLIAQAPYPLSKRDKSSGTFGLKIKNSQQAQCLSSEPSPERHSKSQSPSKWSSLSSIDLASGDIADGGDFIFQSTPKESFIDVADKLGD